MSIRRTKSAEPTFVITLCANSAIRVTASFPVNGHAPGTELAAFFVASGDHVWTIALDTPIDSLPWSELDVSGSDLSGNLHTVERSFAIGDAAAAPRVEAVGADGTGRITFRFSGEPQEQLVIERSPDALDWNPYMTILDFDGSQSASDAMVPPAMFYRVAPKDGGSQIGLP